MAGRTDIEATPWTPAPNFVGRGGGVTLFFSSCTRKMYTATFPPDFLKGITFCEFKVKDLVAEYEKNMAYILFLPSG